MHAGVDYKLVMTCGEEGQDPLLLLVPALTQNNVHVVSKLADKIPCGSNTVLTSGMVFCAFALKLFWKCKEKSKVGMYTRYANEMYTPLRWVYIVPSG